MGNGNVKGKDATNLPVTTHVDRSPVSRTAGNPMDMQARGDAKEIRDCESIPTRRGEDRDGIIDSPTYGMADEEEVDHTVIDEDELEEQQDQDFRREKVIEAAVASIHEE